MRLRNLFLLLLLCMTVGVFSVACTGDDGAQGPKGDTGEQGPPGDDGADAGDSTDYYGFLKSWGSDTGEIACTDPILQGTGVFPGPETLTPLKATDGSPAPVSLEVQCGDVLFEQMDVDAPGSPVAAVQGLAGQIDGELIFVKTEAGSEDKTVEQIDSTQISRAKSVTTTKTFSGGMLFADMKTDGGNEEFFDRRDLFRDCRIGTSPSAIKGHWRAVKIVADTVEHNADKQPIADTIVKATTTKVCLRLDSTPGVVKCFVEKDVNAPTVDSAEPNDSISQEIAIYDSTAEPGMELSTVKAGSPATGPMRFLPPVPPATDLQSNQNQNFFGDGVSSDSDSDSDNILALNVSRLCNLFTEGLD